MESSELEQLIEPCNSASQLLLAHFVALHLVMRPIACRERKTYTVTMYGIRMTTWIGEIYEKMKPEYQELLDWPLVISQLHTAKRLEQYTLAPKLQTDSSALLFGVQDQGAITDAPWISS